MNPKDVSPGNFTPHEIVYTSSDGVFSIAIGEWTEDELIRFAMRWNGDIKDPNDIGYPNARGNPMWFQLPYDIKEILSALIENSKPMQL